MHIRNLSWNLLIDAKISEYPVDLRKIANIYNIKCDVNLDRYNLALDISEKILKIFGYKTGQENIEALAVRILSPLIIIQHQDIQSAEELSQRFGLPMNIANKRYERYKNIFQSGKIGMYNMEIKILNQFTGSF